MAIFTYNAKKINGEEIAGTEEAENQFTLAESLRKKEFILVNYKEKSAISSFSLEKFIPKRSVSLSEKMIFARNLSVMTGAGVPLTRGLEVLSRQTTNLKFRDVILDISSSIRKGKQLSESMTLHPKIFSQLFIAMVRAGETSGKLQESLLLVATQLEREHDLRRKIKSAFMYPAIILISMVAIGIIMMIYVVPTLTATFQELGIEIPQSTKLILGISDFLLNNGLEASVFLFGIIILIRIIAKTSSFKFFISAVALRTPVISNLIKKINAARTARTFGSLVSAGVEVLEALEVTEDVVQNLHFKKVLRDSKASIQKGDTISKAFIEHQNLYPLLVGEMMAVGEETGKLSEMLSRLADFYETEVDAQTKNISTIIEPILMILIGIIVGFFAFSMIIPLYTSLAGI